MNNDMSAQQLHDKATRGGILTEAEQAVLEAWYERQDAEEMAQLAISFSALPKLQYLRAAVSVAQKQLILRILCLLALASSAAFADAPHYSVIDLGISGKSSQAEAINNRGQVVGWQDKGSFLWESGKQKLISTQLYQGAHAINEEGAVVGIPSEIHVVFSGSLLSGASAFVWDRGYLGFLSGFSNAYSINDQGRIAGQSGEQAAFWDRRRVSGPLNDAPDFIWQSLPPHKLKPLPGYPYSTFYGLNDDNEAVGVLLRDLTNVPEHGQAFRYQAGEAFLLPTLGSGDSVAFAVSKTGTIAGASRQVGGQWQALLWQPDGGFRLLAALPGSAETAAHSINAGGEAVGWAFPKADAQGASLGLSLGPIFGSRACLWRNGSVLDPNTVVDLNAVIPADSGWVLQQARAINDKGWIVGGGTHHGEYHAFLLIPAP